MDPTESDRALLTRLQSGDGAALETLFERHHGMVRVACQRQTASAEVDDCVQAVFLVLLRKPAQALRAPVLAAWLLVVARHVCATARRAGRARSRAEQAAAALAPAQDGATAAAPALEHLDACLAQLPSRQRTVIIQHFLAGATRDEIAATLGMEVDTVHQHCHRGIARLRQLLRRRGVVVPSLAMTALLTNQARAAAAVPPATATAIAGPAVTAYATAALTAMTITTLIPLALTALVLALVAATAVVIHAVASPPVVLAAPVAAQVAPPVAAPRPAPSLDDIMAKELSVTFADATLADAVATLSQLSGLSLSLEPEVSAAPAAAPLTLAVEHMRLDNLLWWVESFTNTHHEIRGSALVLKPGAPPRPPVSQASMLWVITATGALARPVTLSATDESFDGIIVSLHRQTGLNIIKDPKIDAPNLTLKINNMSLMQSRLWIGTLTRSRYVLANQAIYLTAL